MSEEGEDGRAAVAELVHCIMGLFSAVLFKSHVRDARSTSPTALPDFSSHVYRVATGLTFWGWA